MSWKGHLWARYRPAAHATCIASSSRYGYPYRVLRYSMVNERPFASKETGVDLVGLKRLWEVAGAVRRGAEAS